MRIGIDIDGVLTNYEQFMLDYATKYCIEHHLPLTIKPECYEETEAFSWTEEQAKKFWNEYLVYYATKYPARAFASKVIHKLKQQGHEIYIVTARNEYGLPENYNKKMKTLVEEWLRENDIPYDRIIYTKGSKLTYCVEHNIEIMIEDSANHIKDIATELPVLCFNNSYNQELQGENITRVYSWYDIYDKIKN